MQCCEVESGGWSSKSAQVRRGCLKKLHREGRKHPGIAQHSVEGWLDPQVPVSRGYPAGGQGKGQVAFPSLRALPLCREAEAEVGAGQGSILVLTTDRPSFTPTGFRWAPWVTVVATQWR